MRAVPHEPAQRDREAISQPIIKGFSMNESSEIVERCKCKEGQFPRGQSEPLARTEQCNYQLAAWAPIKYRERARGTWNIIARELTTHLGGPNLTMEPGRYKRKMEGLCAIPVAKRRSPFSCGQEGSLMSVDCIVHEMIILIRSLIKNGEPRNY